MSDLSLFATLKNLKGNPRAAVLTEPLWGIPFNLYAPYASLYMLTLGVSDSQIGLITSIGLSFQIFFALISGAVTDKFGRKLTTYLSDFLSWTIPTLILAFSQNFTYFLVAAIINSTWRISANSWLCILVEDAQKEDLVNIWALIYVSGLLAAFFSPFAGLLVNQFSLVPTMRGLYLFACVMMTAKFIVMNYYATETQQGKIRMEETRHQSLLSLMAGYGDVFKELLRSPATLYMLGIMVAMSAANTISGTFWGILVTQKLHIPAEHIAIYPFARSAMLLLLYFFVIPRLSRQHFRRPMLTGLICYISGLLLLIAMPDKNYLLLLIATLLEACGAAFVNPFMDAMVATAVNPAERARIMAILYVVVIVFTTPFGWIGGRLSELNRSLPFVLNLGMFAVAAVMVWGAAAVSKRAAAAAVEAAE